VTLHIPSRITIGLARHAYTVFADSRDLTSLTEILWTIFLFENFITKPTVGLDRRTSLWYNRVRA